ncbi:hypothetical protein EV182_000261 [Spiromyces aspiralis]|uniref:Uncharacterized protein n=1 Tax=Spiromyces aspiralis TaxID=68401 RepID=A0ACC1HX10_9FUNG|nr:hypothetical protein EV182_000261 [Spiromyces aspiralis]
MSHVGHMNEERIKQAKEILAKDDRVVPKFWQEKYRREAPRNWDLFYKRNTTNFFRDRHWTEREFEELARENCSNEKELKLLEVGCGVGNFIWPLLEAHPRLKIYACDFSPRAINFVRENEKYDERRCHAFVCDITSDQLVDTIEPQSIDLVSMIFVLSALPPEKMRDAVLNVCKVLRPGGKVMFRDYGQYDAAQLRFKPGHKLEDSLYVRQDGTMAYYFTVEYLRELFVGHAGLVELENEYVYRTVTNAKRNLSFDRVFVQARFQRPTQD